MTRIASGITDQGFYFVGVDATDFTTRETGLSSFTVVRSRNGAADVTMTTPTITQIDATTMPGVYWLLCDEDTTLDAGDDEQEQAYHITHAGMAPVTNIIAIFRPKITAGETVTAASGSANAAVQSIVANAITAASIASDAITDAKVASDVTIASVTGAVGSVTGSIGSVAVGGITATSIAADAIGASELAADALAEIADAILDEVIEGSTTLRQALRGFAAALLSKASGLATTTAVYRDVGDTKDRITATVDASGNRSAVTLDLT